MTKSLFFKKGLLCIAAIAGMHTANAQWVKKADNLQFQIGRWAGMTFTVNNKIYLTGGYANLQWLNDLQEYDPATNVWKNLTTTPVGPLNRSAGVAFVINGKAYVGLGAENFLSISGAAKNLKDLWEYNPTSGAWTQKASLPDSGRTESSVFVVNNKAYIVGGNGGFTSGTNTNQVWEYDPAANKWTKKADYPEPSIANAGAFAINGKGYVSCGRAGTEYLKKTYEYNASSNAWTPKADFPDSGRYGVVSFVVDNKGYVGLGGIGYNSYKKTFFYYNPTTDKWGYLHGDWSAPSRLFGVSAVVGNKAYVGCGWRLDGTSTQTYYRDWHEMDVVAKLGVENTTTTTKLNVYPNPSTGMMHVDVEDGNYTYNVYSITGQKTTSGQLGADKAINLTNLAQGQYILELVSEKQTYRSIISLSK
ncbi:hypothetical protein CAP35_05935 [Chitinophagaceae bacterium IBVUCB1]|nr:hypothetical protein CAP35_05935 [Chitinophagaceae bacterium IBVUCB1]